MSNPNSYGMSEANARRLRLLSPDQVERAAERACIIYEATGCTWDEADKIAIDAELGESS